MIKETDIPHLVRVSQGVFENTNSNDLNAYLRKRDAEYAKQTEVTGLKEQINSMNDELSDIKRLLLQLTKVDK